MKTATSLRRSISILGARITPDLASLLLVLLLGGVAPALAGPNFKVPGKFDVETTRFFGHVGFDVLSVKIGGKFQPIAGDFDANGLTDIFWYSRLLGPSYLWLAGPEGFSWRQVEVEDPTWQPVVGDFDHDGDTDIIWYGPETRPDEYWRARGDGDFDRRPIRIDRRLIPIVGNFDGRFGDDILWYQPGWGEDYLWLTKGDGEFWFPRPRPEINGTYQPLVADFNGDGREDIFFYAAGKSDDYLWLASPNKEGEFTSHEQEVNGDYEPLLGDYDGDGCSDVFWHETGHNRHWLWLADCHRSGRGNGFLYPPRTFIEPSHARPVAGNFDGAPGDEILWYEDGGSEFKLWSASKGTPPEQLTFLTRSDRDGPCPPVVGDFNGDRRTDILWYCPGRPLDALWLSRESGVSPWHYCDASDLEVFPVHFVVLTSSSAAPTATSTHADPGNSAVTYTAEELFRREVDILNRHFVDAAGHPVCDRGYCVRFRYQSHAFLADISSTCDLLKFGDMRDRRYLDSSHPDYEELSVAIRNAVRECDDEQLVDPWAINFYVYDEYKWEDGKPVDSGNSRGNPGSPASGGRPYRPYVVLDVERLLHNIQSPEEHEMGHAFGLGHVCDPGVGSGKPSNIMQSSCARCKEVLDPVTNKPDPCCREGTGGSRNLGFDAVSFDQKHCSFDQVAAIVANARKYQAAWCEAAKAQAMR